MAALTLYIAPGSCSRVPLTALVEIGVPFETSIVRFMAGQHKSPDYKRLNPKGKVPMLIVDGAALTENVAILSHLNALYPGAGLLPRADNPLGAALQIADLCFCSATLHPIVTRIRIPGFFAEPEAARGVWEKGCQAMAEYFALIEAQLADRDWWYGSSWSVMDAYLNWVFWRVEGAGFDVAPYARFSDHARRTALRASHRRALEIEAAAVETLEAEGLSVPLPHIPA